MINCLNCGKENEYTNYCDWECGIEYAKKNGGQSYLPNGLPVGCIRHDGNMYEHEHGDHPDYKFPVTIEYIGKDPDHGCCVDGAGNKIPASEIGYDTNTETHALIYCDGSVAITMYECCYAMWHIRDNELAGGSLWKKGEWRFTEESWEKIYAKFPINN